jgi:membrane protein DedA with SNARE-associated domain
MGILTGLHGATAIAVICVLLFVEETGVPVPLITGDVLLVLSGVLLVNGSISPWEFFPLAFIAEVSGVLVAHLWSQAIGQRGLEAIADRIRARKALDRAIARLSNASPPHIAVARLVPGLRINTSLVAGAAGVARGTFLLGVVPAIIIWLGAYTLLGVLVGVPILASLDRAQHIALTGFVLALIGLVTLVGIRSIPAASRLEDPLISISHPLAMVVSILVDLAIAVSVASGAAELLHVWLDVEGIISFTGILAFVVLVYVRATRGFIGGTAGERLTGARYWTG